MSQILICGRNYLGRCSNRIFTNTVKCQIPKTNVPRVENFAFSGSLLQPIKRFCTFKFQRPNTISVNCSGKRFNSNRGSKLSFDVDANVIRDVTIFTYSNTRFFRMLSIFGIVQFFFWANIASLAYSGLNGLERKEGESQSSWLNTVLNFQRDNKYRIAIACVCLGYVILFFSWIYPLRTISRLVLEKGGQMVRITTYTHFGRTKDFVVPLQNISCTQSRQAKGVQMSLKIKGKWFYYLMDKREGKFVDPHLFDYVVGLNRSLK